MEQRKVAARLAFKRISKRRTMNKKSIRKITIETQSKLVEFLKEMPDNKRLDLFKELFLNHAVELKLNAVGMLIVKSSKSNAETIYQNLETLGKSKEITVEKIVDSISKGTRGEEEPNDEPLPKVWDSISLRHAKNGQTVIKAKTPRQEEAIQKILENKVTMLMGSPGTGKTFLAMAVGLKLLELRKIQKIVVSKPPVESGPGIGFLPGTEQEKMQPYLLSVMSILTELVGAEKRDKLLNDHVVEVQNIGYLRGMTLGNRDSVYCVIDEAQNVDFAGHKLILTRLGGAPESRLIFAGDQKQSDLVRKKDTLSVIHGIIKDSKYVGSVVFQKEDVVRSPVVKDLLGRIEDFEDAQVAQEEKKQRR